MTIDQKIRIKELLTSLTLSLEIHMKRCSSPLKSKDRPDLIVFKYVDQITAVLDEPDIKRRRADD